MTYQGLIAAGVILTIAALVSAQYQTTDYIGFVDYSAEVSRTAIKISEFLTDLEQNKEVKMDFKDALEHFKVLKRDLSYELEFYEHQGGSTSQQELITSAYAAITLFHISDDRQQICDARPLDAILQAIDVIFEQDLLTFAQIHRPTVYPKSRAYLLHHIKKPLSNCLAQISELDFDSKDLAAMDRLVVQYGNGTPKEHELLEKAKELDFVEGKFDTKIMLKAIESNLGREKLSDIMYSELESICRSIHLKYGDWLEIYNWSRILIPAEANEITPSVEFLKLNEYHRACLPLLRQRTQKIVMKNLIRNVPLKNRMKQAIKKLSN